jgi:hypothetical protein
MGKTRTAKHGQFLTVPKQTPLQGRAFRPGLSPEEEQKRKEALEDAFLQGQARKRQQEIDNLRQNQPFPLPETPTPSVGENLAAVQGLTAAGGYEFDRPMDSRNRLVRGVGNKLGGALHYVKKHPVKTMAKVAVPFAAPAMNLAGAFQAHGRMRTAQRGTESSTPPLVRGMYQAHARKQKKQRNKAAIGAVVGLATTAAGGAVDFGAGDLAADLGADFLTEGLELATTTIAGSGQGAGLALAESAVEDVAGTGIEDIVEESRGGLAARGMSIKTSREARLALKQGTAPASAAHEVMLARDPKYGKAVREGLRRHLPSSPEAQGAEVLQGLEEAVTAVHQTPEFQARDGRQQQSVRPSDILQAQKKTSLYSETALRRQLAFNVEGKSEWDDQLDALSKKKFYEA